MSATEAGEPSGTGADDLEATQLYLAKVITEIDEEVARRRSSGDLPPRAERELDELFLKYSPMAGRDGSLEEAMGVVESSSYFDPVVPVLSSKPGGALVKRSIRQASLWYVGWLTEQMNRYAMATTRVLRVLDERLRAMQIEVDAQRQPVTPVIETDWAHGAGAWWADRVVGTLGGAGGRVLHAAAGDGWLVRRLAETGVDAYGVEPREGRIDRAEVEGLDLREEPVVAHLGAVAPEGLGALVLTGVVDGMPPAERQLAVRLAARAVAPSGHLIVHSLSLAGWSSEEAPVEADLAGGEPLRPRTWAMLLAREGFEVEVVEGPGSLDFLVVAVAAPDREGREGAGGPR